MYILPSMNLIRLSSAQQDLLISLHKKAEENDATADFSEKFLAVSKEQGEFLANLIIQNSCKNIIEFGSSLGISTIYIALAAQITSGNIIATERMPAKAHILEQHLLQAGVLDAVTILVGPAEETLHNWNTPIDFLFLDGQKNLYWQIYTMLKPNFHPGTVIVADNTETHFAREYKAKIFAETNATHKLKTWERSEMIISTVQ